MKDHLEIAVAKVVTLIEEKKVEDFKTFFMSDRAWISDYVLLVSVQNALHAGAIINTLKKDTMSMLTPENANDFYEEPRVSGSAESGWCIVDLNSILIHLVTDEVRTFYKLDTLLEKQGAIYHL